MSMKGKTLLKGHTLRDEGAAYVLSRFNGRPYRSGQRAGEGQAQCSCGALSPVLSSMNARKRWHREHKEKIRSRSEHE